MGPRLRSRGSTGLGINISGEGSLQWVRGCAAAVAGFISKIPLTIISLQWVRGCAAAVACAQGCWLRLLQGASMGPRLRSRGSISDSRFSVSMLAPASMGPRLRSRGSLIELTDEQITNVVLQWVRGCAAAVARGQVDHHRQAAKLQWVRGCAAAVARGDPADRAEIYGLQWVRGCAAAVATPCAGFWTDAVMLQWVRGCAAAVAARTVWPSAKVQSFNGSAAAQPR